MKVLIIEDSAEIVEAVSLCLQLRWPEAVISFAAEGKQGVDLLEREPFDIVILDINLPDIDGFEVLKHIRSCSNVPTVILTVRGRDDDQARGLELGADDYIVKPFKPKDLMARVNAVLRRSYVYQMPTVQARSRSLSDFDNDETGPGDRPVRLTPTEARLLYLIVETAEAALVNEQASLESWSAVLDDPNQLKTIISKLKSKLSDSQSQTAPAHNLH